jgi:UDP-galactopyranose mutase
VNFVDLNVPLTRYKNHKIMDEKKKKKTKIKIKIEYLEMLFCEDIQATWTISNN